MINELKKSCWMVCFAIQFFAFGCYSTNSAQGQSQSQISQVDSANTVVRQNSETTPVADSNTKPKKPNILFCIADDASYPHMSAYGCKWVNSPGFDRVAKAGLLFNNAYTPNAKCAPSRACILTGRNSWQLKEAANHWPVFPTEFKTYCEALSENGYHVGKTTKGWAPGIALDDAGKRRQLTGKGYEKRRIKPPTTAISKSDYAGNFEDFLTACPEETPWCFWYGSEEPHRRYEYGSGVRKGKKKLADVDKVFEFWPDNEKVRNDILDYAFEIEHFDSHLSRMLDMLEKSGQLDNTIVVVTADNGMPFPRIKGQEYELSNHLPLAIMWPKGIQKPGRKIDDYVSFIDFAPTFLQATGLDAEKVGMRPITGKSLFDIFESTESGQVSKERDHVLIGKERHDIGRPNDWGYPIRGIVQGKMLYLKNFEPTRWPGGDPITGYLNCDGGATKTEVLKTRFTDQHLFWQRSFGLRPEEEFFDLSKDPECVQNLAGDPKAKEKMKAMKSLMEKELKEQLDPRILGNGKIFDNYKYADKNTADFYNRYMRGETLRAGWVSPTDFDKREPKKQ